MFRRTLNAYPKIKCHIPLSTVKLGYNELGYNELGYNELDYNELGYNELGYNEHSVITNKFFSPNYSF